jgi:hypothetical protein
VQALDDLAREDDVFEIEDGELVIFKFVCSVGGGGVAARWAPGSLASERGRRHKLLDLTAHKALLLDPCSPLITWRLMLKPETCRLIEVARSVEPREGPEEDSAVLAFFAELQS